MKKLEEFGIYPDQFISSSMYLAVENVINDLQTEAQLTKDTYHAIDKVHLSLCNKFQEVRKERDAMIAQNNILKEQLKMLTDQRADKDNTE